jgi:hypothetical protein
MSIQDANGNIIVPGDIVIYNLSGELANGTVVRIDEKYKENSWGRRFSGTIFIKMGGYTDRVSKVKNPFAVFIIKRDDGTYML